MVSDTNFPLRAANAAARPSTSETIRTKPMALEHSVNAKIWQVPACALCRAAMRRSFLAPAAGLLLCAAAPPVSFTPVSPQFADAAGEYRRLWQTEGPRIVAAMEAATGLAFPPARVEAIVSEGRPMASFDGRTIRLRAGYSPAYKKATLAHEIGHRLAFTLPRGPHLDDHRLLYLFLYDVWTDLYGREFADRMVSIERRIGPAYEAAWDWALAMSRAERQTRLAALRSGIREEG